MKKETVVIGKQRITKKAHEKIQKKAEKELRSYQSVVRQILHNWALKN